MGRRVTYEDLDIRRDGTVYYNNEPKNCYYHVDGYLMIGFSSKNHLIHRLIAEKYIPNPENKPTVNHINGIKDDNRVENLEWNTRSENMRHAYNTGLNNQNHTRKLTIKEVSEVREKYIPRKYTQRMLSEEYGVPQSAISYIINKKTYKEVG